MNKHINVENSKMVARFVVGTSVKFVVATAIVNLVPAESNAQKAKLFIGTVALSSVVSNTAKTWTSNTIDETVEFFQNIKPSTTAAE